MNSLKHKLFKKKKDSKKTKTQTHESHTQWEKPTWVKENNVIDYLSEDDDVNGGLTAKDFQGELQKYVCVSCCALRDRQLEEEIQKFCEQNGLPLQSTSDVLGKWMDYSNPKQSFKVRGSYASWETANKRVEYLRTVHDGNHFIFVGEVGKWLPFNPDPNKIQNQNYYESQLNDLHENYEKNQAKTKEHFETRKQELMRKARLEGSKWGQENYMKEVESKAAVEHKIKSADEQIAEFDAKIKEAQRAKELALKKLEYMETHPEVVEKVKSIEEVIPEDIKDEILSKELSTNTVEALSIHREIDASRKPLVVPQKPKGPSIQEINPLTGKDQTEGSVHDVFNSDQPTPPFKKI